MLDVKNNFKNRYNDILHRACDGVEKHSPISWMSAKSSTPKKTRKYESKKSSKQIQNTEVQQQTKRHKNHTLSNQRPAHPTRAQTTVRPGNVHMGCNRTGRHCQTVDIELVKKVPIVPQIYWMWLPDKNKSFEQQHIICKWPGVKFLLSDYLTVFLLFWLEQHIYRMHLTFRTCLMIDRPKIMHCLTSANHPRM